MSINTIIAGGREFNNYSLLKEFCLNVFRELKKEGYSTSKENVTIISGKARGTDTLGEKFQKEFNLNLKEFPANWNKYGKRAGHLRNKEMADYAMKAETLGILIAFWDGKSKGTKNMISNAEEKGLKVYICRY